jgi:ABC-type multidrug transport system ATPase subunit
MNTIDVIVDGVRRTLGLEQVWVVRSTGFGLEVVEDTGAEAGPEVLGRFVHFARWTFRATDHPQLAALRINGAQVEPRQTVPVPDEVEVGYSEETAESGEPDPSFTLPHEQLGTDWRTIGRAGAGADIEFDDPTMFARHAAIRPHPDGGWLVVAKQGTVFVDGASRSMVLVAPGAQFVVGQTVVTTPVIPVVPQPAPAFTTSERGLPVQAINLHVNNGKRKALTAIDFEVPAGTLVAVVGPSGAGKSTLMGAMLGGRRIVAGELRVDHVLLCPGGPRNLLHRMVHFVPQQDHLYADLTVWETLTAAARLRLAGDMPAAERDRRVGEVIDDIGLSHRRHAKVGELSGGERRRTSIGVELVGKPRLLLLDEPTSGLDVGKDRAIMQMLRRISRSGCTVMLNTHCVTHLEEADQLLILGADGQLAYSGRPAGAVPGAAGTGWADFLDTLADPPPRKVSRPVFQVPQTPLGRQATVVMRRGCWHFLGIAILPVGGAVVAATAASGGGLHPGPALTQVLAILITVAALSGAALSYLDVVSEEGILKRDWRAGRHAGAILSAKFAVYALLCAFLAGAMTATFRIFRPGSLDAFGLPGLAAEFLVVFLVLVTSMAYGLFVSAAVSAQKHAITINTILAIAQVVLNGSLFELPSWMRWPTAVVPARLGFAAAASFTDLDRARRGHLYVDPWWGHTPLDFWLPSLGLVLLTLLAWVGAVIVLRFRWWRRVE